jgi:GDP-L-fucose synthase
MRKFHEAKLGAEKKIVVWGTGTPFREFMHVDDLADCCLFLMRHYDGDEHINIGTGEEIAIGDVARILREIIHPEAELVFDDTMPDGVPRRQLDVGRLEALGWRHRIQLREGLESTYAWLVKNWETAVRGTGRRSRGRR